MERLEPILEQEIIEMDEDRVQRILGSLGLVDALTEPIPITVEHEDTVWLGYN